MKNKLLKVIRMLLCVICSLALLSGCENENSKSKERAEDNRKQEIQEKTIKEESEKSADNKSEKEQTQENNKYPIGINKGAFSATRVKKGKENEYEREVLYYKDATHISRKDSTNNIGKSIFYIYQYNENDKLTSCEVHAGLFLDSDEGRIVRGRILFDDNSFSSTSYDENGNEIVQNKAYFDEYGMILKEQGVLINEQNEDQHTFEYEYEYYDNGNIKSITRINHGIEINNKIDVMILDVHRNDLFLGLPYFLPQGKLEFDEEGRKINDSLQTSKGNLSTTWKYDENGWPIEETIDCFYGYDIETDEIKTDVYTWEYKQLEPGMITYDEVFGE